MTLGRNASPAEIVALVVAVVLPAFGMLRGVDDAARATVVRALSPKQPPPGVFHVSVTSSDLRDGACGTRLERALRESGARAALLWSFSADVCTTAPGEPPAPPITAAPRILAMDRSTIRFSQDGRARGWTPDAALAAAVGVGASAWVVVPRSDAVAGANLADLAEGRVSASVLRDRFVVVSVAADERTAAEGGEVAAIVGGVVNGGARGPSPRAVDAAIGALACWILVLVHRRRREAGLAITTVAMIAVVIAGGTALTALGAGLIGFGSVAGAIVAAAGVLRVPAAGARRRSLRELHRLLDVAARGKRRATNVASDAEFFSGIAAAATSLHPCDVALVADVVDDEGTLRFWGPKGAADALFVGDKNVRKYPFCDEAGVPSTRVARGMLAMPNMPVVVAALTSGGSVEGSLVLCGERAVRAHLDDPERTSRIAREVSSWLRARRRAAAERTKGHGSVEEAALDGARAIVDDAMLLEDAMREAPFAVLHADATGSVRFVARQMRDALVAAGVALPGDAADGPLAHGTLSIEEVLRAFTELEPETIATTLTDAMDQPDGVELAVTKPRPDVLELRVLRRDVDQVARAVGWLVTLQGAKAEAAEVVETKAGRTVGGVTQLRLDHEFVVHDAWEATSVAIDAAISIGRAPVKLASPRMNVFIIAQRTNVFPALTWFLVDVAKLAPADQPPVVSLREKGRGVEISLMDLHLGLSRAAVQRVLDAAGSAPKELRSLGKLVYAVEQSQGTMRLRGEGGWGTQIVISLPRARTAARTSTRPPPAAVPITTKKKT